MAASAYASLVSLSRILKQVLHPSKQHWIGFDRDQMMSLDDKVCSLVPLFEDLSNRRQSSKFVSDELMNQLANAGNEAEDLIDSFVANMFRAIKRIDESDGDDSDDESADNDSESDGDDSDDESADNDSESDGDDSDDESADNDSESAEVENNDNERIESADDPAEVENRLRELNTRFCEDISRVAETMDLMNQKLIEIQNKMDDHHQHAEDGDDALSSRSAAPISSSSGKNVMVGFEDHLDQMMSKLTTVETKLQIIPIVGMGGMGKTTLARNIYEKPIIVDYFHARAWVTLSQTYTIREVLLDLLCDAQNVKETKKEFSEKMSEIKDEVIGEQLRKSLFGRKYLIVIDDIWSTTAWDEFKRFFPDYRNGSRIMITTRLSNVAICLSSADNSHKLDFLDEDKSWNLFCDKAFPEQDFPVELEEIGKKIAKGCGGLPLAIVAIGGLLANSSKTPDYWEYVSENLNSIINSGDDEYCLKLLSLSYNDLPIHLKPCFLYMGMLPEDCEILVARLVKLLVAEGFLKPIKDKSFEDVAMVYLRDLIDRNLILVSGRGKTGKIKTCTIHDILRDLCIREANKENFLCAIRVPYSLDNIPECKRRLAIHESSGGESSKSPQEGLNGLESASNARSLVCWFEWISSSVVASLNLVRVLDVVDKYSAEEITKLSSLRYVAFKPESPDFMSEIIPSKFPQWNLQSFVCREKVEYVADMPSRIWEMTELRHLRLDAFNLPDPPPPESDISGTQNNFYILENLQTLTFVFNLRCTDEVIKRVPNLRKLEIYYNKVPTGGEELWSYYCINNLVHLHKLESLTLQTKEKISATNIVFPHSLKRLRLIGCGFPWSDIKVVGSLPKLEVLGLQGNAFEGERWDAATDQGQFLRLKSLAIHECDLKYWTADNNSTHFPMLEKLWLNCSELEEIPIGLAEIPTLKSIDLYKWNPSVITSARRILEERDNFGYEGLQVEYYNEEQEEEWIRIEMNEED